MMKEKEKPKQQKEFIPNRNFSDIQFIYFEKEFEKRYPKIYQEFKNSTSCISGIMYEIYVSDIFYKVMK